jgi:hypothetical protein
MFTAAAVAVDLIVWAGDLKSVNTGFDLANFDVSAY